VRKFVLSGLMLAALVPAGASHAADILPGPAPLAPEILWQGFYIGLNGGGASGSSCWNFVDTVPAGLGGPPAGEGCNSPSGAVAGGQLGYNWQISRWVFGLEAQGDWANISGQNVSLAFPTTTNRVRWDALGLFTGRIGLAWGPLLLYVKGGGAVAQAKYDFFGTLFALPISGNTSETRWGATVGGGFEYRLTSNWSAAVEYDYVDLGKSHRTFATTLGVDSIEDIDQHTNVVTGRLNYRFP